jgi:hypothetical protein
MLHSQEGITDASANLYDQYIAEIRLIIFDLSLVNRDLIKSNLEDDIFLESLVMHVRNAVIGYQRFITKSDKSVVINLCNELEQLKLNYENNKERIAQVENQLCRISDLAMKKSVAKSRHFEIINSEKITPLFLKLAKGANTDYSLSDICDDTGHKKILRNLRYAPFRGLFRP